MVVYVAPLVLRGLQNEALNSNVLTHYSLERRTSENTGVRSTERVVSFQCISVEINFDILPQGLQSFASQRALRGDVRFRSFRREPVFGRGVPAVRPLTPAPPPLTPDGASWVFPLAPSFLLTPEC